MTSPDVVQPVNEAVALQNLNKNDNALVKKLQAHPILQRKVNAWKNDGLNVEAVAKRLAEKDADNADEAALEICKVLWNHVIN